MEDFGTVTIRIHVLIPAGQYSRGKAVVLHRYHGHKDEALRKAARFVKANPQLRNEVNVTWEVREACHVEDLPSVSDDNADD